MRTGTPQAERIVHRLGFLTQGFANSAGHFASGSIWRQIIISWKYMLALQWKAVVWSSQTSQGLKTSIVGGKRNVLKWHLFYVKFSCLWWNKSMKSVAYSPTQQKVRIQMRKDLQELPSYFTTWKSKRLSFVGPEKIIHKKVKKIFSWFRMFDPMWNANYGLKKEMEVPVLAERHRPFVAEQRIWCLLDTLSALHQNLICLNKTFLCRGNLQSWTSVIYTSI